MPGKGGSTGAGPLFDAPDLIKDPGEKAAYAAARRSTLASAKRDLLSLKDITATASHVFESGGRYMGHMLIWPILHSDLPPALHGFVRGRLHVSVLEEARVDTMQWCYRQEYLVRVGTS